MQKIHFYCCVQKKNQWMHAQDLSVEGKYIQALGVPGEIPLVAPDQCAPVTLGQATPVIPDQIAPIAPNQRAPGEVARSSQEEFGHFAVMGRDTVTITGEEEITTD